MTARQQQQRPPLAFCVSCNARERAIVAGRCIVCGNPPKVTHCRRCGGEVRRVSTPMIHEDGRKQFWQHHDEGPFWVYRCPAEEAAR